MDTTSSEKTTRPIWSIRQRNALLFYRMVFAIMAADATSSIKKSSQFQSNQVIKKPRIITVKYSMGLPTNLGY